MNELLKEKLANLPSNPGVYIHKDIDGNILYVGKAKNLKNRVNQYFNRVYFNKTANLVKHIHDFEYIVTFTEKEALVLEINLIKQYLPPYNVIFMDDKHYPYIALSKDEYPRLIIRRDAKNKKYIHYGPFPDSKACYETLNLLNRLYPLRKCKNIPKTSCLYYHINQCLGPCINKIDKDKQKEYIQAIDKFFKGNQSEIIHELENKMYKASDELNFEKANEYKKLIESVKIITNKQVIEFNDKVSRDVVGFYIKDGYLSISILMYRNGYLNAKINEVMNSYEEVDESIISFLCQFYEKHDIPKEIYVSENTNIDIINSIFNINVFNPKSGIGQELILLAVENAKKSLETRFIELASKDEDVLEELGSYFNKTRISTIEMCDMSHISGDSAVGVVIVFKNGYPVKNKYRKFIINQENKKDDLASTYEVIYRRFYNQIKDNQELSDMFIVDGGINQIGVARKAFDALGIDNVILAGLSKDDNHRTRYLVKEDGTEIAFKNDSKLFLYLMKMQDEVHRFAITFFKDKKTKSMFSSILDGIEGLGDVRKKRLLSVYSSIDEMKNASVEQLAQIIPLNVANKLKEVLSKEK